MKVQLNVIVDNLPVSALSKSIRDHIRQLTNGVVCHRRNGRVEMRVQAGWLMIHYNKKVMNHSTLTIHGWEESIRVVALREQRQ